MKNLLTTLILMTSVLSCGGGSSGEFQTANAITTDSERIYPVEPLSCDLSDMRQWVEANMLDYYLFYDQVARPNLSSYNDLSQLINDMRVSPNDRFSYISDAAQSSAQFEEGIKFGFGHLVSVTPERELRVTYVYPGSPFDDANIKRGDYIESINGTSPFDATQQVIRDFFGADNVTATQIFVIRSASNQSRTVSLSSRQYAVETVMATSTIVRGGISIGYLAFDSFLETSEPELDAAFAQFRADNIQELVLDLRYNRGGRVDVSNKLASLIIGAAGTNQVFTTFSLNNRYREFNESIKFNTEAQALDLPRLIVLTTEESCSASELIVNGLRPYMNVVTVGSGTCGKPYGSSGRVACGKQMNALQFEFVNGAGAGGYYEGIPADCDATDQISRSLGDPDEGMLSAALSYIETGVCNLSGNREVGETGKVESVTRAWRPFEPGLNLLNLD